MTLKTQAKLAVSLRPTLLMVALIFAPLQSSAQSDYVVDLNKTDWALLCPSVLPITLEQAGLACEVSHPASKFHSKAVYDFMAGRYPSLANCDYLKEEFDLLIQPYPEDGKEWGLCYSVFRSALQDRVDNPGQYKMSTQVWLDGYFNENTEFKQ